LIYPKLVLASSSSYRAALLMRLQVAFDTVAPEVDESPFPGELPAATALRLAVAKARAVQPRYPDSLVIGSDQVAELGGQPIGKPGDREHARAQLRAARGKRLVFHTALCVLHTTSGRLQTRHVPTTVVMRDYSDREIESYLDKEPAFDCAGSAKSEGLGIALIAALQGDDPTALIGLPLIALADMLRQENFHLL
jgi:septum formation protein